MAVEHINARFAECALCYIGYETAVSGTGVHALLVRVSSPFFDFFFCVQQVYLKLPAYTSAEALEAKLMHAITEGQDHFALD